MKYAKRVFHPHAERIYEPAGAIRRKAHQMLLTKQRGDHGPSNQTVGLSGWHHFKKGGSVNALRHQLRLSVFLVLLVPD
jgi:hypothetical protein